MSFLGNVIWLLFGGLIVAVGYIIGGIGLCLTLVGIPFGVQSIKLGVATLAPFGKEVVVSKNEGPIAMLFDIIWLGNCPGAPGCRFLACHYHRRHPLCQTTYQAHPDCHSAVPARPTLA